MKEAEKHDLFHPVHGLMLKRSNRILKKYNLKGKVHSRLSTKKLVKIVTKDRPVIASIHTPNRARHLVLVCGVEIQNHQPVSFTFLDPSSPPNEIKNNPQKISIKEWGKVYNFRGLEILKKSIITQ